MLIDDEIEVVANHNTMKYYRELGYTPPEQGQKFWIKPEHLPKHSRQQLRVRCSVCNDEKVISPSGYWGNLERNGGFYRCNTCATTERNKAGSHSVEEAQELFRKAGLIPLFTEYIENKEPLPCSCSDHPEGVWHKSLSNVLAMIRKGVSGCPRCTTELRAAKQRITFDEVRQHFIRFDVELLSDASELKNHVSKLRFVCRKHPEMGTQVIRAGQVNKCLNICKGCTYDARRGTKHPNYKLDAELGSHLRQALQYWRTSSLELFDYACEVTGERGGKLVIHHLVPQHVIRNAVLDEYGKGTKRSDYTEEELADLTEAYVLKHYEQPIAAVITEDIHRLYHSIYGHKKNNTIQNFYEFKRRYQAGEYSKESK